METNDIVKTNDPNITLYKELSEDFIKKEDIVKAKSFFLFLKNKVKTIDNNSTEANIESLLKSIFEELTYSVEQQKGGQIDGEQSRVDILLFENDKDKANFNKKLKEAKKNNEPIPAEDILLIVEVKNPSFNFYYKDKVKEAEEQLYRYLNQYQKHYGVLSNGKVWRHFMTNLRYFMEKKDILNLIFLKLEKKKSTRSKNGFLYSAIL